MTLLVVNTYSILEAILLLNSSGHHLYQISITFAPHLTHLLLSCM